MHCTLTLTRCLALSTRWVWTVKLPNGHVWSCASRDTITDAVQSMQTDGVMELAFAERAIGVVTDDQLIGEVVGRVDTDPPKE